MFMFYYSHLSLFQRVAMLVMIWLMLLVILSYTYTIGRWTLPHGARTRSVKLDYLIVHYVLSIFCESFSYSPVQYLNGGPGCVGGHFVHEKHAHNFKLPRYSIGS